MHQELIGTWELVSREGQDNPPAARRVFGKHTFQWDDHGRPEGQRELRGKYRVVDGGDRFVTRPNVEHYTFCIDGDTLHVQRVEPSAGAKTTYRRV